MGYTAGNVETITCEFFTAGIAVDPTTVSLTFANNGVTYGPYTYAGSSTPGEGYIYRTTSGNDIFYKFQATTAGFVGPITGTWSSTGTGQASQAFTIYPGATGTATLGSMIAQVFRRIQPGQQVEVLLLASSVTPGATSLTVSDPAGTILPSLRPGLVISVDLEEYLVEAVNGTAVTVQPGYLGSVEASHQAGALIYINPRFAAFDIQMAINDDLADLCSTESGLFAVRSVEVTYNPAQIGYDLTDSSGNAASGLIEVLSVQQRQPYPINYWIPVPRRKWNVTQSPDLTYFPSGYALRINQGLYPGMPIRVTYKANFSPFANLGDDATGVAGLASTMYDLPPLGAMVALVAPREVKRNQIDNAPDSRRATEVPPGAVMNSIAQVLGLRQRRIMAEATRLRSQYGVQAAR